MKSNRFTKMKSRYWLTKFNQIKAQQSFTPVSSSVQMALTVQITELI